MKSSLCASSGPSVRTMSTPSAASRTTSIIVILVSLTSCIYDAPGDEFYRTLWTGTDNTLGKVTVEFLCGDQICIKSPDAVGSYGTYQCDGQTASFKGLSLRYDALSCERTATGPELIIIEEAHSNGDTITLLWHLDGSSEVHTLVLERLSAYE